MRTSVRLLTATCSLAVFATPARAQDQIPKELALALIPFGASEGGEIIVGKLPPELAAGIAIPPGGRILGSFVTLGYAQAVITLPFGTDSARGFVRQSLLDRGWTARDPMAPRGGLQYGAKGTQPTFFCKTGNPSGVNLTTQFYGRETLVRLTMNGPDVCDRQVQAVVTAERVTSATMSGREPGTPFDALPPLWSPGDPMTSMRTCRQPSMGFSSSTSQQQELKTEMTAQQILAYYGKQLDSAGWKSSSGANESATAMWAKPADATASQEITLIVTKMTLPGCYQIQLRSSVRGAAR